MQHTDAYWKMRRKLAKGLGNQIDEIQAEKKNSKTEVNPEVLKHFQALRQKTDEVLGKLKDLQDAGESTRENLKEELEKELDDLKAAVDDAISRFR